MTIIARYFINYVPCQEIPDVGADFPDTGCFIG